jgi:xanthine dehydrogenase small subunit
MKKKITFICNDENISIEINPALTVLDYLRDNKRLTGTKEGCREGDCGACTVIVGRLNGKRIVYQTINSCLLPIADLNGKHLVSIEGLNLDGLNIIQEQMVDEGGTQCGFCTPGFIISMTNYFINHSEYDPEKAALALDGNICRCTGYLGIRRAIQNVIAYLNSIPRKNSNQTDFLMKAQILPEYFSSIPKRLKTLSKEIQYDKPTEKKIKPRYVVSGGTDLFVQKWESLLESNVRFISGNEALKEIRKEGNTIFIGGAVTISEFENSPLIRKHLPEVTKYLNLFGSQPIRNRATIAGNIVNASPIADMTNILLALSANLNLTTNKKKRSLPLNEFYLGYKTLNKKEKEIIENISIEIPSKEHYFNYERISRRTYLDIASVNTAALIKSDGKRIIDISISAGGVAPIPLYLKSTCNFFKGKEINSDLVDEAAHYALSEISPISDARGSAEYKSLLLKQLLKAHFIKLFPQLIEVEVLV